MAGVAGEASLMVTLWRSVAARPAAELRAAAGGAEEEAAIAGDTSLVAEGAP